MRHLSYGLLKIHRSGYLLCDKASLIPASKINTARVNPPYCTERVSASANILYSRRCAAGMLNATQPRLAKAHTHSQGCDVCGISREQTGQRDVGAELCMRRNDDSEGLFTTVSSQLARTVRSIKKRTSF